MHPTCRDQLIVSDPGSEVRRPPPRPGHLSSPARPLVSAEQPPGGEVSRNDGGHQPREGPHRKSVRQQSARGLSGQAAVLSATGEVVTHLDVPGAERRRLERHVPDQLAGCLLQNRRPSEWNRQALAENDQPGKPSFACGQIDVRSPPDHLGVAPPNETRASPPAPAPESEAVRSRVWCQAFCRSGDARRLTRGELRSGHNEPGRRSPSPGDRTAGASLRSGRASLHRRGSPLG
jgi:hypothetical protein